MAELVGQGEALPRPQVGGREEDEAEGVGLPRQAVHTRGSPVMATSTPKRSSIAAISSSVPVPAAGSSSSTSAASRSPCAAYRSGAGSTSGTAGNSLVRPSSSSTS